MRANLALPVIVLFLTVTGSQPGYCFFQHTHLASNYWAQSLAPKTPGPSHNIVSSLSAPYGKPLLHARGEDLREVDWATTTVSKDANGGATTVGEDENGNGDVEEAEGGGDEDQEGEEKEEEEEGSGWDRLWDAPKLG